MSGTYRTRVCKVHVKERRAAGMCLCDGCVLQRLFKKTKKCFKEFVLPLFFLTSLGFGGHPELATLSFSPQALR